VSQTEFASEAREGAYSKQLTTPSGSRRRRHLASSPFQPEPEPTIDRYAFADLVCHDVYGVGRVTGVQASAVTVDFGRQTVRIISPSTRCNSCTPRDIAHQAADICHTSTDRGHSAFFMIRRLMRPAIA
jgi:hypothetical protein